MADKFRAAEQNITTKRRFKTPSVGYQVVKKDRPHPFMERFNRRDWLFAAARVPLVAALTQASSINYHESQ
jgi:hypothetical protein